MLSPASKDVGLIVVMKENIYILYRRTKAYLSSLCFYICRVFPVQEKLVSVCTFEGKGGFGCNPKYIVSELHRQEPDLKFVWFLNKEVWGKEFPEYIKKVPNTLWSRAYWLSRSKVWIDNYRKPYGTKKRKNQLYINTWHGMSGFKSIGLWRGKSFSRMAYLVSKNDSEMVDYFLSDSDFTKKYFPKGLVYDGEFLQVGSPRCDVLLKEKNDLKSYFHEKYKLDKKAKCIMFAPTYREAINDGVRSVYTSPWKIDFERLLNNMKLKFGGDWYLVMRLHPQIASLDIDYGSNRIIDVSKEDDMYEILSAMDALITDYSSCAMDAMMMKIPIFIFADDIEKYSNERGAFTWNITKESRKNISINKDFSPSIDAELPFTISKNNDELAEDIQLFDEEKYIRAIDGYEKSIKLITRGDASKKVADIILSFLMR